MSRTKKTDPFKGLTWDDLENWAGEIIVNRGRNYNRDGLVKDLARTPEGNLTAWVLGTKKYATQVEIGAAGLNSSCTCPYDDTCKHAVAVVLTYLDMLNQGQEPPPADDRDERFRSLAETVDEGDWENMNENGDEAQAGRWSQRIISNRIHDYLARQTKKQLISLLEELSIGCDQVHQVLHDRCDLSRGSVKDMIDRVGREIDALSAEPAWRNRWNDEGHTPDYSGVCDRLEKLLQSGHADEVLALGEKLLDAGTTQLEMSQDEGETWTEIAACLGVVFDALPRTSLSPGDKLIWAADAILADDYELCRELAGFWSETHPIAAWSELADNLSRRLEDYPACESRSDFSRQYKRDRVSDLLIMALEKAGRVEEIIPLCEREAKANSGYVRLVRRLAAMNRWEEAESWIREGYLATRNELPGIASELRKIMRTRLEETGDWRRVADLNADDFFHDPSARTYAVLRRAVKHLRAWSAVQNAIMHYLETGELPRPGAGKAEDGNESAWPLSAVEPPPTDRRWPRKFPMARVLLDIAMADSRPDQVLRWYDAGGVTSGGWGRVSDEDKVAEAVAEAYPDRAVAIWKKLAEGQVALTQKKAYEEAARYLRKVQRVLVKMGLEGEWRYYLAEIKKVNARKPRLMEILEKLKTGPIVEERSG